MIYTFFQSGDQRSHLEGRIRAAEQDHFQYSVDFKMAESSRDADRMLALQSEMNKLEAVISSLHEQLNNITVPRV